MDQGEDEKKTDQNSIEREMTPLVTHKGDGKVGGSGEIWFNIFQISFYSIGFCAELFYSLIFWTVPVRFVRDVYFFSLQETSFQPGSLQFLGFFLPPFIVLFLQPSLVDKIRYIVFPTFNLAILLFFSLTTIAYPLALRTTFEIITSILSFVWFDLRLRVVRPSRSGSGCESGSSSVRATKSRFILSQFFALFVAAVLRFASLSFIPFYLRGYYAAIYIIIGVFAFIWLAIEEAYFVSHKDGLQKLDRYVRLPRFAVGSSTSASKTSTSGGNKVFNKKCVVDALVSLLLQASWSLGFAFLIHLLHRFVSSPTSLTSWSGLSYFLSIVPIAVFAIGTITTVYIPATQSPLFVILIVLPSVIVFYCQTSPISSFVFGVVMVFLLPSLFQFYMNANELCGDVFGGVSLSSVCWVIYSLAGCSVILNEALNPFGYIFGDNPVIYSVVGVLIIYISIFVLLINRFIMSHGLKSISTVKKLAQVFLFPCYEIDRSSSVDASSTSVMYKNDEITAVKGDEIKNAECREKELEEKEEESQETKIQAENIVEVTIPREPTATDNGVKKLPKSSPILPHYRKVSLLVTTLMIMACCVIVLLGCMFARYDVDVTSFSEQTLRVASFNVFQGYNDRSGNTNAAAIVDFVNNYEIDVLGMQESNTATVYNGYTSLVDFVGINAGYQYYQGLHGWDSSIGAAVFSKHKILSTSSFAYPLLHSGWFVRVMNKVEFVFNNTLVFMVNVHLDSHEDDNKVQQVQKIIDTCSRIADEVPIIVTGDFNSRPNTTTYAMMKDFGFRDCFAEVHGGYEETIPDYVFVKGEKINVVDAMMISSDISDHHAVVAELTLG